MNHQYFVALHVVFYCLRWISRRKMFWVFGIAHETFHRWIADNSKQQINKGYCFLECDAVSYNAAAPFLYRRVYSSSYLVLPILQKEKSRKCLNFPPEV
jgi:hypothetical protein